MYCKHLPQITTYEKNFEKPNSTFKFNSKPNSLTLLIYICLIIVKADYYYYTTLLWSIC